MKGKTVYQIIWNFDQVCMNLLISWNVSTLIFITSSAYCVLRLWKRIKLIFLLNECGNVRHVVCLNVVCLLNTYVMNITLYFLILCNHILFCWFLAYGLWINNLESWTYKIKLFQKRRKMLSNTTSCETMGTNH